MARTGISFEQVEQAADALVAEGRLGPDGHPTLAAVRERLGTGSPNTIHGFLKTWKARRPAAAAAAAELPSGLIRAIGDEIERSKAEARAEIEARLVTALAEAAELARAGTALEAEYGEVQIAHEALKADHDQLVGSHAELQKEIERMQQQLEDERRATATARVDLAKAQHSAEVNEKVAAELRNDRDSLRKLNDEERAGRVESERSLAGATASLQELRKNLDKMIELHDEVEADRDELQKSLDAERGERSKAEKELAACQAQAKAAKDRADDLQQREQGLRSELAQLRATAAPPNTKSVGKRGDD